eukprot:XP_011674611.1 PREDICTED: uncharacterized protein LOC754606 [Strongylocentrotus purpuratus]
MASFDLNTPLDDMELKFISRKLGLCDCIILSESLCIGTPLEDLVRQYQENKYAPSGMLFTWHSNQDPAKERSLMPAQVAAPPPPPPRPPPPPAAATPSTTPRPPPVPMAAPAAGATQGRVFASPLARKLAAERGININTLQGTGPAGRIVKADIESYVPGVAGVPMPAAVPGAGFTDIPVDALRMEQANAAVYSKQTIPHYYLMADIDVGSVLRLQGSLNEMVSEDTPITLNEFVIKAAALSCQKIPDANSAWFGDKIRQYHNVDVNIAVTSDYGTVTPIINAANTKLDYISGLLSYYEFITLGQSLSIATSSQELTRQYMKNANAPSEMLNTWHSNQVPAKERRLLLDYISGLLSYYEFITLGQSLSIATSSQELTRQYMKNANAPSEMLNTWHSNQVPAKERRLLVKALNKSGLCSLAKIVQRVGFPILNEIVSYSPALNENRMYTNLK